MTLADAGRILLAALLMLMAVLILRLGWNRWRDARRGVVDDRSHPFIYASYACALFTDALITFQRMGESPHWPFLLGWVTIILGVVGISRRVTVDVHDPHHRRRHDDP